MEGVATREDNGVNHVTGDMGVVQRRDTQSEQSNAWQPHHLREVAIHALEKRLEHDPDNVALLFERACLLAESGKFNAAKTAYIQILMLDPAHLGALNNLGTLLYQTGYRTAALTTYHEAVVQHPEDPAGHVNLANLLYENGDYDKACEHYEAALQLAPTHHQAHQGLSYVLTELGDEEGALFHRQKGFEGQSVITQPYYGEKAPVSVLLLMSAIGGNTPTRWLLDDRVFQVHTVIVEYVQPTTLLPPHQLIFNAISDADLAASALIDAKVWLESAFAPVINPPSSLETTGRLAIAKRFCGIPGLMVPRLARWSKASLIDPTTREARLPQGWHFPILLRVPGFHTGRHFIKVDHERELSSALDSLPGQDVLMMEYIDVRGADGKYRKYRVMMIGGQLYPLHLAISSDWKVHYFTSDMANHAAYREEEAKFLEQMQDVLGAKVMDALQYIQKELGLDYAGLDFTVNEKGDLVLFEANATMVVVPPDADPMWEYRRPAVNRIVHAAQQMMMEKIR